MPIETNIMLYTIYGFGDKMRLLLIYLSNSKTCQIISKMACQHIIIVKPMVVHSFGRNYAHQVILLPLLEDMTVVHYSLFLIFTPFVPEWYPVDSGTKHFENKTIIF